MNNFYPAIFTKEGKKYNVKFIDFDYVFTFGDNFEDAYYMAQDALKSIDNIPKPTNKFNDIKLNKNEYLILVKLAN